MFVAPTLCRVYPVQNPSFRAFPCFPFLADCLTPAALSTTDGDDGRWHPLPGVEGFKPRCCLLCTLLCQQVAGLVACVALQHANVVGGAERGASDHFGGRRRRHLRRRKKKLNLFASFDKVPMYGTHLMASAILPRDAR